MRHRLFPVLQRLAFTAMLALACVPTLGRMGQGAAPAVEATQASPAHAGHRGAHAEHASQHAVVPEAPQPAPHHGETGDCDYCPLLQGLLTPGIVPLAPAIAARPAEPRVPCIEARFAAPHPTGLGSRGPPIA